MTSEPLVNYLKRYEDFSQLPDDSGAAGSESFAGGRRPSARAMKEPPPGCPIEVWEKYLRGKWDASDLFPEGFDPQKLEKKRLAQLPSHGGKASAPDVNKAHPKIVREKEQPLTADDVDRKDEQAAAGSADSLGPYSDPFPKYPDGHASAEAATQVSARADVIGKQERHEGGMTPAEAPAGPSFYQRLRANAIEAGVLPPEDAAGTEPATTAVQRCPTPRIRTGSKPPLSKSAYANSCPDPDCGGGARRGSSDSISRVKAPTYFPFQSRMRKGK